MPESHLAGDQIELPHPAEPLVVESGDPIPVLQEATVPVLERLGIVQAQNLDVGREQSRLLNRRHDLRQGRNIGPWEDVLADEGIDRRGLVEAAGGMEQANAVIVQQVSDLAEELAIVPLSDVFEHADGDDPVEGPRLLAVIAEMETDAIDQTGGPSPRLASGMLLHAPA